MGVRYGPWQKITHRFSDINIILLDTLTQIRRIIVQSLLVFFSILGPLITVHYSKICHRTYFYLLHCLWDSFRDIYIESAILWQPLKSTIQVRCCLVAKTGIYLIVIFGQHYIYLLGNRLLGKNDLEQVFLLTKVKSISNHSKLNWIFFFYLWCIVYSSTCQKSHSTFQYWLYFKINYKLFKYNREFNTEVTRYWKHSCLLSKNRITVSHRHTWTMGPTKSGSR